MKKKKISFMLFIFFALTVILSCLVSNIKNTNQVQEYAETIKAERYEYSSKLMIVNHMANVIHKPKYDQFTRIPARVVFFDKDGNILADYLKEYRELVKTINERIDNQQILLGLLFMFSVGFIINCIFTRYNLLGFLLMIIYCGLSWFQFGAYGFLIINVIAIFGIFSTIMIYCSVRVGFNGNVLTSFKADY